MPALCKYAPEKGSFYCKLYETILCPGNRENCVRYESEKDFPLELHKFCVSQGIEKACIVFEDETAYDYLWLSDKEFQLSRVGDCATNYTVP